jgi:hypothetical protein
MQRIVRIGRRVAPLSLALVLCWSAACNGRADEEPPKLSASVQLSRTRVAQGSPVDLTYRFEVLQPLDSNARFRVFTHILDADEELMWTDDHVPPQAPSSWQAGQTIEYQRTMWAPMYPYVGRAKVVVGVYDVATNARVPMANADRGDRSYQVAEFDLLPQTENIFVVFKDGWHAAEVAEGNPAVVWQWTKKEATLAFRNPRRDVTLLLQFDNPSRSPNAATTLDVRIGDTSLGVLPVTEGDTEAPVHRLDVSADLLGSGDMVEVRLIADRTFIPSREAGTDSADWRELGVRVFHAYVMPR